MKYNVIGDIHGRTSWKDLVIDDGINIFVGDYFSPYDKTCTFENCLNNFLEIIEFKKQRPETVLLLGNHDADHWQWLEYGEQMTRHHYHNESKIKEVFEANADMFQIAYSAGNQYLITHAGVSMIWLYRNINYTSTNKNARFRANFLDLSYYDMRSCKDVNEAYQKHQNLRAERYKASGVEYVFKTPDDENLLLFWNGNWYEPLNDQWSIIDYLTPDVVAHFINRLWKEKNFHFTWRCNRGINDFCGDSITQSPMWIRPEELLDSNIFREHKHYKQVVGHTQFEKVVGLNTPVWSEEKQQFVAYEEGDPEVYFVDCLGKKSESFVFEC